MSTTHPLTELRAHIDAWRQQGAVCTEGSAETSLEWTVYTANCGECGGRGGQDCGGDKWADCPYCKPEEDCALCGEVFDTKDAEPKRLLADGRPQSVCNDCWALEPAEEDVA